MRSRLVLSTIVIVLVVLAALALPIALIVLRAGEDELRARLDSQANAIAAQLSADLLAGREPDLAVIGGVLGVDDGARIIGPGGSVLLDRGTSDAGEPMTVTRTVTGATGSYRVEVSASTAELSERFRDQISTLVLLSLGGLLAAAGLAAVQAHQLARPLERLATSAARIGDGDFSTSSLPVTKIPEIDRISEALRSSGARVDHQLTAERHFTADATHQLRTGLTGIAIRFELLARHPDPEVVAEATAGLQQTDVLAETIDELLEASRHGASSQRTEFDLGQLARIHVAEWQGRFTAARRSLHLEVVGSAPVFGTKGFAGQVLDIFVHNALIHGDGIVTVHVEGASLEVSDQGEGLDQLPGATVFDEPSDPSAAHGRGLPLARRLARADGGSVDIVCERPLTIRYRLNRSAPTDP